jgi:hypothetical protein
VVPVGTSGSQTVVKVGTDEAGDVLDGRRWQDFPKVAVPLSARKPPKRKKAGEETVPSVQRTLFGLDGDVAGLM